MSPFAHSGLAVLTIRTRPRPFVGQAPAPTSALSAYTAGSAVSSLRSGTPARSYTRTCGRGPRSCFEFASLGLELHLLRILFLIHSRLSALGRVRGPWCICRARSRGLRTVWTACQFGTGGILLFLVDGRASGSWTRGLEGALSSISQN